MYLTAECTNRPAAGPQQGSCKNEAQQQLVQHDMQAGHAQAGVVHPFPGSHPIQRPSGAHPGKEWVSGLSPAWTDAGRPKSRKEQHTTADLYQGRNSMPSRDRSKTVGMRRALAEGKHAAGTVQIPGGRNRDRRQQPSTARSNRHGAPDI